MGIDRDRISRSSRHTVPAIGGVRRARHAATLSPDGRRLRREVVTWALATGRRVDYDALTVILACAEMTDHGMPVLTEDDVWRMWWFDLSQWCTWRGVPVPDELAGSMATLFAHLDATGGFGEGSDHVDHLVEAMESAGALWRGDHQPAGAG